MSTISKGQVSGSAAEVYETFFVPALFQAWAPHVADRADVEAGHDVLDVACGTGVLAREMASRVRPAGSVVGLDVNDGMLAVARRAAPDLEWVGGAAESLPFDDERFDAVVSQFGLMFFTDPRAAIREMIRVLRRGRRLVVAVWDRLDHTPGYAALADVLQRLFGDDVAESLHAPYSMGDLDAVRPLFETADVGDLHVETQRGTARFSSLEAWMYTDVKGWTASDRIDDEGFRRLVNEAKRDLSRFVTNDGRVAFDTSAHIVTVVKR